MFVDFNILNQLGSPSINSNTFANRPPAGQIGRLFVSTDTFEIYRDNGTTWDLIGGPGSSTITGTGTATQVAYFTSSQAIGSSSNLYWDNTNIRLGIGTSTPGTRLDIHGTGIMQHINATGATANSLMAFQRTGTNVWRLGDQYNGGNNFFEIHNIALANNAIQIDAATNKSIFTSIQNYVSGLARANYFDYTLNLPNGTTISSPNAVTTLGSTLNLNIAGSATLPNGARSGMDVFNGVNFTSAGTFTINQASTIRAFSNLTSGWAFNGSAVGTITHLAGLRVLFPTNSGSAINVTDNYALLINNQNANTGTITYTNRWGIYQEGSSDLNYMAANLLLGSTVNTGDKLQVTGTTYLSSQLTVGNTLYVDTVFNRVGIGTLSPGTKLETNGTIFANITGNIAFLLNSTGTNYGTIQNDAADVWSLGTGITSGSLGTPVLTWLKSGNVGIGTTSPGAKLTVIDEVRVKTAATSGVGLSKDGSGAYLYNIDNTFMAFGTNNTERMRITSGGDVGIGTSSPLQTTANRRILTVNGTNQAIVNLGINGSLGGYFYADATSAELYSAAQLNLLAAGANPMLMYTNGSERIRIASSGNVLIGTTTDAGYKLDVNGSATFRSTTRVLNSELLLNSGNAITFDGNASGLNPYIYHNSTANELLIRNNLTNGKLSLGNANGSLTIISSGNAEFTSSIKTGAPTTGTAAAWKLGSVVAAAVALDATKYIEVEVGGVFYKLAIVV